MHCLNTERVEEHILSIINFVKQEVLSPDRQYTHAYLTSVWIVLGRILHTFSRAEVMAACRGGGGGDIVFPLPSLLHLHVYLSVVVSDKTVHFFYHKLTQNAPHTSLQSE